MVIAIGEFHKTTYDFRISLLS